MVRRLMFVVSAAIAAGCSSGYEAPPPAPADAPDASLEVDSTEIVSGVADRGRDPAVIAIDIGGEGLCSGTLIAPRVVLTARHCVSVTSEGVSCPAQGAQISSNRSPKSLSECPVRS